MIDLRNTRPAPVVRWSESPYGGSRGTYEWSTLSGGLRVTIDHPRPPVWTDGRTAGSGLDADFLAAMDRLGILRETKGSGDPDRDGAS